MCDLCDGYKEENASLKSELQKLAETKGFYEGRAAALDDTVTKQNSYINQLLGLIDKKVV
jgi:FtsZ-binding cell division protein ZapB